MMDRPPLTRATHEYKISQEHVKLVSELQDPFRIINLSIHMIITNENGIANIVLFDQETLVTKLIRQHVAFFIMRVSCLRAKMLQTARPFSNFKKNLKNYRTSSWSDCSPLKHRTNSVTEYYGRIIWPRRQFRATRTPTKTRHTKLLEESPSPLKCLKMKIRFTTTNNS